MPPSENDASLHTQMRKQYDYLPYPECDLNFFPTSVEQHYIHALATPYYLRYQKVIDTNGKVILDAGCGSGMQALALATANPGAKIIGVDISEQSVRLAQQRCEYHKIANAEFHALPLEELPSLGYRYDLINCDEVLYLMPNPATTLQLFQSVLSEQGIIRANLHSLHQRREYYRTQEFLKFIGIYDEESIGMALSLTKETLNSLNNHVRMKAFYQDYANNKLKLMGSQSPEKMLDEWIFVNYLLRGDRGYTIPELFAMLETANLEFLCMVNWRQWQIEDLFQDPNNLPLFWQLGLESASESDKLHLYELLNPVHRLFDFWCLNLSSAAYPQPPLEWTNLEWETCLVYLHPVLQKNAIEQDVLSACQDRRSLDFRQYIKLNSMAPVKVDCEMLAVLLPLWKASQPFATLVERWLSFQPLFLTTGEPKSSAQATHELQALLSKLEFFKFILLEKSV